MKVAKTKLPDYYGTYPLGGISAVVVVKDENLEEFVQLNH